MYDLCFQKYVIGVGGDLIDVVSDIGALAVQPYFGGDDADTS